jgi:hypothetical protein
MFIEFQSDVIVIVSLLALQQGRNNSPVTVNTFDF